MRTILSIILSLFVLAASGRTPMNYTNNDKEIFNSIIQKAQKQKLSLQPINEIVVQVGKEFLGKPYVAHTLETAGDEQLVVNLRELDCTTFVESVLALSITIHNGQTTFDDYCANLIKVRYRNSTIDQYPSRQHYFTDWIYENQQKALVEDITRSVSDTPYEKQINFMSENADKYEKLKGRPQFIEAIKATEKAMNQRAKYYIPLTAIPVKVGAIQPGDIIALTPSLKNLDITHVGFAVEVDGKIHFMHASMTAMKVTITTETLHDFLKDSKRNTGIMVVRVK